jgi:hypothetical protein
MLCQLVCVDRRYQRMNCFNIRELQSILKRKFFTDLVNSNDHHTVLANSMVGLRFKTNSSSFIDNDMLMFYNYGTTRDTKVKSNLLTNGYYTYLNVVESTSNQIYAFMAPVTSISLNCYLYFLNVLIDPISYLNPFTSSFSTNRD